MQYNTTSFDPKFGQGGFLFDLNSLYAHLETLKDNRDPRGVRYPLVTVLVFVILAKLAGEDEPAGIADWVSLRKQMLEQSLSLKCKRMPHAITYSRILGQALQPEDLQTRLNEFFSANASTGKSIAVSIDGKILRGTIHSTSERGLYLLAAYLPQEGIVLMQVEIAESENELTQAPRLLKSLDLRGKVVTGDALFAQQNLSELVVEAGGDYIWIVKDNQPSVREKIEKLFEIEEGKTRLKTMTNDLRKAKTIDKGHGRVEQREITVSGMMKGYLHWPHIEQVFKLEREVLEVKSGKSRHEIVYGLTSLTGEQATAARLMELARGHWGIENGLHYRRDATMKEDRCRLRIGRAAHAMAIINNLVIGLILRQGLRNVAKARRRYDAYPLEALNLLLRC